MGVSEVAVLGLFIDVAEGSAGEGHGPNPAVPLGAAALGWRKLEPGDVVDKVVGWLEPGESPRIQAL